MHFDMANSKIIMNRKLGLPSTGKYAIAHQVEWFDNKTVCLFRLFYKYAMNQISY